MARGTFANIRLINKFIGKAGPKTLHIPSGNIVRFNIFNNHQIKYLKLDLDGYI